MQSNRDLVLDSNGISVIPGTSRTFEIDDYNHFLCAGSDDSPNLVITWDELEFIVKKNKGCYALYDDGSKPWLISTMSIKTGFPLSLCPPLESSGYQIHIVKFFNWIHIAMLFEAVLCIVKLNHSTNFRPLLFFT
jgi:hypothetical protein